VPALVVAVNTPKAGWLNLPAQGEKAVVHSPEAAQAITQDLAVESQSIWHSTDIASNGPERSVTWYVAGTMPDWGGMPLAITVLLEENDPALAEQIGQTLLKEAMMPK
jgi:hypothetical protein